MYLKFTKTLLLSLMVIFLLTTDIRAHPITIRVDTSAPSINENTSSYEDFKSKGNKYTNVMRYKDIQYFVQLKQAFKIKFNPVPVLEYYLETTPHNKLNKLNSISTIAGVEINSKGKLIGAFILESSGISEYDEEVLRTVRVLGEFSAPPKSYLDKDSILRMAWTFTVYL